MLETLFDQGDDILVARSGEIVQRDVEGEVDVVEACRARKTNVTGGGVHGMTGRLIVVESDFLERGIQGMFGTR